MVVTDRFHCISFLNKCDILVRNCSSTRSLVATVLSTHPYGSRCLGVKKRTMRCLTQYRNNPGKYISTKLANWRQCCWFITMTSLNENIFRVTDPLCGDFTGQRWIPPTRSVTRNFDVFFGLRLNWILSKQSWRRWFETPSRSLWRHYNVMWLQTYNISHEICTKFVVIRYTSIWAIAFRVL